jgi:hypothetical protein
MPRLDRSFVRHANENARHGPRRWAFVLSLLSATFACSGITSTEPLGFGRERAALTPPISADFALATRDLAPSTSAPILAAASGPTGYLLVVRNWESGDSDFTVAAMRVDLDGRILDPEGLPVDALPTAESGFWAVHTGTHWLLLYPGGAVTIGDDGSVGTPFDHENGVSGFAWGGDRALALSGGVGRFLGPNGAELGDAFGITGGTRAYAAFNGSSYLVAASNVSPTTVWVVPVSPEGVVGSSYPIHNSMPNRAEHEIYATGITSDGRSFLVSYMAPPPGCGQGGRCTPIRPYYRIANVTNGVVSVGPETDADPGSITGVNLYMNALYANGAYLLWRGATGTRVDSEGRMLGETSLGSVAQQFYDLLGNSAYRLIASLDGTNPFAYLGPYGIRVGSDFSALDHPPLVPVKLPIGQRQPTLTFNGENFVAAWIDAQRGLIFGTRVTPAGEVLDAPPLSLGGGTSSLEALCAASNGTNTLLLRPDTQVAIASAAIVERDGSSHEIDLSGVPISSSQMAVAASDGANYLLTWHHSAPAPARSVATLVSGAGDVLGTIQFAERTGRAAVAFDGTNYVVVWSADLLAGSREIRALRINPRLELVDAEPKPLMRYETLNTDLGVQIASNGTHSFVVWASDLANSTVLVSGLRVTRELVPVDTAPVTVATFAAPNRGIRAAWDGTSFWVLFPEFTQASAPFERLLAERVRPDGSLRDPEPFVVSADLARPSFTPDHAVDVAAGNDGKLLVAYERTDVETEIRARILNSTAGGTGGTAGTSGTAGTGNEGGSAEAGAGGDSATGGTSGGGVGGVSGGGSSGRSGAGGAGAGGGGMPGGAAGEAGAVDAGRGGAGEAGAAGSPTSGAAGETAGEEPAEASGCGCSVPRRSPSLTGLLAAACALLAFAARRRATR